MKKIFFLSLLSVALYSCSNDDFDVTSNNTGSYMETIESKSNLVLENGLDNSLTDSLKLDDMDSVTSFKVEYIKKSSINQNYKSHNNISRAARYSYDGIVNGTPKKTLSNQKVLINGEEIDRFGDKKIFWYKALAKAPGATTLPKPSEDEARKWMLKSGYQVQ